MRGAADGVVVPRPVYQQRKGRASFCFNFSLFIKMLSEGKESKVKFTNLLTLKRFYQRFLIIDEKK